MGAALIPFRHVQSLHVHAWNLRGGPSREPLLAAKLNPQAGEWK